MHHLSAADVRRLLPMPAAIEAARSTARTVAAGQVHSADRIWHRPEGMPGTIGVMPAHLPDDGADPAIFTTKLVGVFADASPSVNGMIAVQDATTGAPLVTVDAAAVTALRTAASSGLSVDLLARPGAHTVAIIGAGVQGVAHLDAVMVVRQVDAVRIWNRTPARAEALATRVRGWGLRTSTHATVAEAAAGADIVCVCTDSPTPVLTAADVGPGTHVTAIGAYRHDTRELAADLMARADHVVVDDRTAASHEAGDVLMALAEGAIGPDAVSADLADLVTGAIAIRPSPADITVYKSVGTSAMDAVAVRHLLAADAAGHLAVDAAGRSAVDGTLTTVGAGAHGLQPHGGVWVTATFPGPAHGEPGHDRVEVQVLSALDIDWAALDTVMGVGHRRRRVVATLADGTAQVVSAYVRHTA